MCIYSYSRRRNVITPLQILSSYTKQKAIHIFIFTLLYLRRIKPLQYINPPIIVRVPERNGALHCAAHFCVYGIYIITNNDIFLTLFILPFLTLYNFPLQHIFQICEDILMRCAVNSIFDCAGVLTCTPSNQIIEVCKQIAK